MRLVLRKNQTIDNVKYLKHEEFYLIGISWTDQVGSDAYYIQSKSGKKHHGVDTRLFDFDCRDLVRKESKDK